MSKVNPSEWEPPEHLSLSEREFLVDRAETVHGIIAASYLQVGQVLLQVKRKFKSDPDLNGWFTRWIDETLPFSSSKAGQLISIAEAVESNKELVEVTKTHGYRVLYDLLCLPENTQLQILQLIQEGERVGQTDLRQIKESPEVALEAAQETVERMEANLLRLELELDGLTGVANRKPIQDQASNQKRRLKKALQQLQEKQAEVDALGKERTSQEVILGVLRKQLKHQELIIENINLDPQQARKREVARTVVDATKGLEILLGVLDRYDTDMPDIGLEALTTIERKMEEVKQKLLRRHGQAT
jgi:hypothetical protein